MSDELWHTTLETNLSAAFYFCRAAGRYMVPAGEGKVVNVGSSAGDAPTRRPTPRARRESPASPRPSPSNGRPAASRSTASRWGASAPPLAAERIDDPEESERFLRMVPMKRYAAPGEIGELVLFLCGPGSDFMTGQTVHFDGGRAAL
jgi:NAD(P)-dependent dehydrogenase (short-subunit alcohol dehydrogenase family)